MQQPDDVMGVESSCILANKIADNMMGVLQVQAFAENLDDGRSLGFSILGFRPTLALMRGIATTVITAATLLAPTLKKFLNA